MAVARERAHLEREARKVLQEGHIAAVEKTLNEEQREKFAEIRAEFGDRYWGGKMRGHRGHDNRGWGGRGHRARDAFGQLDISRSEEDDMCRVCSSGSLYPYQYLS